MRSFFCCFGVFQGVRRNSVALLEVSHAESATVMGRLAERRFPVPAPFPDDEQHVTGYEAAVRRRQISCDGA